MTGAPGERGGIREMHARQVVEPALHRATTRVTFENGRRRDP